MDRDYVLAPQVVSVGFSPAPVFAQAQSLMLLNEAEGLSGFGAWVEDTYAVLTPQQRRENIIVMEGGFTFVIHDLKRLFRHKTIAEYVDSLASEDANALVQRAAQQWHDKYEKHREEWDHPLPDAAQLLTDKSSFVAFMNHAVERENADDIWEETFDLYQQPNVLVERIHHHIHDLWDHFLRDEWERALPMLQESLNAFQRLDYSNITLLDAIRTVTGRDMTSKLRDYEHTVEQVVFTPSPHLGPYITRYPDGETLRVMYGARLPRGVQGQSAAFSRAEVLVRMNALADDTRLRILEMLTRTDELCAQDIIETLGLSQSTVSRHLGQLTASGFLVERRRDVNKCYSLNTDRVVDTVRALTNFLTRQ